MSRRFFALVSLLFVPLAQVACSGNDSASTGDDQNITRGHKAGEEGGMCGGIAGIQCKSGLACKLAATTPHPDASGTCQKDSSVSGEGGPCGDDVAIRKTCAPGLTCVFPTSGPISEHRAGTCKAPSPTCGGEACGDGTRCCNDKCQPAGLACHPPPLNIGLDGDWGADDAIMTFKDGKGRIEFGCADASIDEVTFTSATAFTATGTHQAGSGIPFPPGQGPKPVPATFKGTRSGDTLTLEMKFDDSTSKMTFTKDRHVDLIHCL